MGTVTFNVIYCHLSVWYNVHITSSLFWLGIRIGNFPRLFVFSKTLSCSCNFWLKTTCFERWHAFVIWKYYFLVFLFFGFRKRFLIWMNIWKITAPLSCLVTSEILCYQGFKSMKTRYNFGLFNLPWLHVCLFVVVLFWHGSNFQKPHDEIVSISIHLNYHLLPPEHLKLDVEKKK